ncbi:MAG: FliM/FliN family flagellar motor switch protein [Bryobacterales bacterium]|nr:FliM/FliN family flagellar motor switch protein [Bryobacterales bacterium]
MSTTAIEKSRRGVAAFGKLQLDIEATLFHRQMTIREVLSFKPGDVLRLQASPGTPVDLRISNRRLAAAELMQIRGNCAVRIVPDGGSQGN